VIRTEAEPELALIVGAARSGTTGARTSALGSNTASKRARRTST